MNIGYLNRIDAKRQNLSEIKNGLVVSFWKSTVIDFNSFEDVDCEVLKEVLIEELQDEIEERVKLGKTNITKIKLLECSPCEADYVYVKYSIRQSFVKIKDILNVRIDESFNEKEQLKLIEQRNKKIENQNLFNNITKWV